MLYAIIGKDVPESVDLRASARPEHLARLKQLQDEGHLVLAGPFPAIDSEDPGPAGFSGSLIVAEFADFETASTWANKDPFVAAGVYKETEVFPFKGVLP